MLLSLKFFKTNVTTQNCKLFLQNPKKFCLIARHFFVQLDPPDFLHIIDPLMDAYVNQPTSHSH